MLPRTLLLSKKSFHSLLTCIPSFLPRGPSSFSTSETMGKQWPIQQRISTSALKSKTESQQQFKCTRLGPIIYLVSPHHTPSSQAKDTSVTQVGSPVKSLLKPLSQNFGGVFSHPQQTDKLYEILDCCHNYGVIEKELVLHQEDSNPGPFQLFRLTAPFYPLSRELLFFLNLGH